MRGGDVVDRVSVQAGRKGFRWKREELGLGHAEVVMGLPNRNVRQTGRDVRETSGVVMLKLMGFDEVTQGIRCREKLAVVREPGPKPPLKCLGHRSSWHVPSGTVRCCRDTFLYFIMSFASQCYARLCFNPSKYKPCRLC